MSWTTVTPTVDGYYWWRDGPGDDEPAVVEVQVRTGWVFFTGADGMSDMSSMRGQWQGPLVLSADRAEAVPEPTLRGCAGVAGAFELPVG